MARSDDREVVATLQSQSAFKDCSRQDLEDLAECSNHSSVPAGWSLIQQNTPADACYVILSGEAEVSVKGSVVATLTSGAVVGETGLVAHKLRNATVTSTTPLELLHIEADAFSSLVERRPALKAVLLARTQPAADAAAQA
jgi:CRP-like cAMP-binding protein